MSFWTILCPFLFHISIHTGPIELPLNLIFSGSWSDDKNRFLLPPKEILELQHPTPSTAQSPEFHPSSMGHQTDPNGNDVPSSFMRQPVISSDVSKESELENFKKIVLIDPLDGSVIARRSVPTDACWFTMTDFFTSVPLILKHSAGLRAGGEFNWVIYTELLLSSSMREGRIATVDEAPVPPHVLTIRNALLCRVSLLSIYSTSQIVLLK